MARAVKARAAAVCRAPELDADEGDLLDRGARVIDRIADV